MNESAPVAPGETTPRHHLRTAILVLLALLAVAATARALVKTGTKGGPRVETVPVSTSLVSRKAVPLEVKAIGNVEAYSTVSVRALVSGELTKIHFRQGQEVAKGDLLFSIDPRALQAALDQAEGTLAKDRSQLENNRSYAARYRKLLEEGISSKELYDQYRTAAETQASTVRADEAAVENARVQLSYATIRSPIAGMTGNLLVYEGNLVKPADTTPLVTITQSSPIYVTFAVPEGELPRIKAARAAGPVRVEVAPAAEETAPLSGELSFVDNAVDMTTGTIRLKATFPNRDHRLWPGQFVKVTVTTGITGDAIVVPPEAVLTGQDGSYVYVVREDQTVEVRPVKPGPSGESVAIIEKGLTPGERIVTDGQLRLSPGAKIEPKGDGKPDEKGDGKAGRKG